MKHALLIVALSAKILTAQSNTDEGTNACVISGCTVGQLTDAYALLQSDLGDPCANSRRTHTHADEDECKTAGCASQIEAIKTAYTSLQNNYCGNAEEDNQGIKASNIIVASDFTSQLDGWEGSANSFLSTQDAINSGNSYLRKEINMFGNENEKHRMVIRRPTGSDAIESDLWLGDFNAKGVKRVELDFNNWSDTDSIYLRLALSNSVNGHPSEGIWWVSKTPAIFQTYSGWGSASFNILEDEMQRVINTDGGMGTNSFEDTLSSIRGFRFIASQAGSSAKGDVFSGAIGMDNVRLFSDADN